MIQSLRRRQTHCDTCYESLEFYVKLITVGSKKHLPNRHKDFAGAQPLVFTNCLFCLKITEKAKTYICTVLMLF